MPIRSLALCLFLTVFPLTSFAESQQVTIGLLAALSGRFSQLGTECRDGYELARSWLAPNDRLGRYDLEFLYGDCQEGGQKSVSEFKRFVSSGASVVLSAGSYAAMPINAASKRRKIPLVGVTGHRDFRKENPYAFQIWPSSELEAKELAKYSDTHGYQRILAFTTISEYPQSVLKSFVAYFHGDVIKQEVGPGEIDFRTLIAKARTHKVDAVFANLGIEQIGIIVKQLRQLRVELPIISNFWAYGKVVSGTAGEKNLEGLVFVMPAFGGAKFKELSRNAGIEEENVPAYTCFTSLVAVLSTLKEMPSVGSAQQIYKSLLRKESIELPDGPIEMNNRLALFPLNVMKYHSGAAACISCKNDT